MGQSQILKVTHNVYLKVAHLIALPEQVILGQDTEPEARPPVRHTLEGKGHRALQETKGNAVSSMFDRPVEED